MNLRTWVKNHLIARNYVVTRFSYHLWWHVNSLGKQPLVIFQMGKVGSTSIRDSLEALNLGTPVFQVHVISQQGIDTMEQMYYGKKPSLLKHSLLPETKHLFAGHFLQTQLRSVPKKHKWKVITLVRDPIARNVSEFFYSVDTTKSDPYLPGFYEETRSRVLTSSELVKRFLEKFNENSRHYELPLTWFDTEFKVTLGIDVYAHPFPMAKGYQIINGDLADVLVLKVRRLGQVASAAFDEFLDLHNFNLITTNTAREKNYYPAYKQFTNHVRLSVDYVDKIYASKYMRHFYGIDEIEMFREKWCGPQPQG